MIPYSRPEISDLYTLSQSKLLENHTLHSGTYLYSPYMAVPPRATHPPTDLPTSLPQPKGTYLLNQELNLYQIINYNNHELILAAGRVTVNCWFSVSRHSK